MKKIILLTVLIVAVMAMVALTQQVVRTEVVRADGGTSPADQDRLSAYPAPTATTGRPASMVLPVLVNRGYLFHSTPTPTSPVYP